MINLKKISPIIIFGVPILIGGYFIYKSFKKGDKSTGGSSNGNEGNTNVETNSSGGVTPAVAKLFPLKKGSRGSKVEELQKAILIYDANILPKYGADKDFGSETEKAVKSILGKNTVDSQDDIDKIITLASKNKSDKETVDATNLQNSNRKALAEKLLTNYVLNKKLDFYAIKDVQIEEYKLTTDGREYEQKFIYYKPNDKIEAGNAKITINSFGFFTLDLGKKRYYFSPYGFELR
jgi:hypothetical protein